MLLLFDLWSFLIIDFIIFLKIESFKQNYSVHSRDRFNASAQFNVYHLLIIDLC